MKQQTSPPSMVAAVQDYLLKGWRVQQESALLAVCAFITLSVTIVVILGVCVSTNAAGLYSISLGGLLMAVGLVFRVCRTYADGGEPDLDVATAGARPGRLDGERGSASLEFACLYPLMFFCLAMVGLLSVHVSTTVAGLYSVSAVALFMAAVMVIRISRANGDENEQQAAAASSEAQPARMERQRGSAFVEFALIYPLVFVTMGGLFGMGQAFYTYNSLQSAMRSAARYASLAPYDLPNGNDWKAEVRNMAVYGDPNPGPNAQTLIPGFTLANVQASADIPLTEPTLVTVAVTNFEVDFIFAKFNISQPIVKFPFLGRSLIP